MTPARQRESARIEALYGYTLNRLGSATALDAIQLYRENISPDFRAATNTAWLQALILMLFGFRSPAQRLAIAYYRLQRALLTGYTVALDGETPGESVTLDELRDAFEAEVDTILDDTEDVASPPLESVMPDDGGFTPEDADIEIEEVADVQSLIDNLDDDAEEQVISQLDELGLSNLTKNIQKVPDDAPDREGKIAYVYDIANTRQAAAAMRIAQNAARGLVYDLGETDLRVLGWVRYSTSGDPCAFCAMLISRGMILYSSKETAQRRGRNQEEDKFHDNCRCVAVPLFLTSQYDSELYDQNRHYSQLWDDHIAEKFSGNDALNQWRTYLRKGFPDGTVVEVGAA